MLNIRNIHQAVALGAVAGLTTLAYASATQAQAIPGPVLAGLSDSQEFIDPFGETPDTIQVFDNFVEPAGGATGPYVLDPAETGLLSFTGQNFLNNPAGNPSLSATDLGGALTVTSSGNLYNPGGITEFTATIPVPVSAVGTRVVAQVSSFESLDLDNFTVSDGGQVGDEVELFIDNSATFDPFGGFAPPEISGAILGIASGVLSGFDDTSTFALPGAQFGAQAAAEGAVAGAGFDADFSVITEPGSGPNLVNFIVDPSSLVFNGVFVTEEVYLLEFLLDPGVSSFDLAFAGADSNVSLKALRVDTHVVPEPTAAAVLGLGGLALLRRRRG